MGDWSSEEVTSLRSAPVNRFILPHHMPFQHFKKISNFQHLLTICSLVHCLQYFITDCSHSVMSDSLAHMDCSYPDTSAHGILQARILEWVLCPSSTVLQPRDQTWVPHCRSRFFDLSHWDPNILLSECLIIFFKHGALNTQLLLCNLLLLCLVFSSDIWSLRSLYFKIWMIHFVLPTTKQDCNKCILVDEECVFVSREKYIWFALCSLGAPPTNTTCDSIPNILDCLHTK